nr:outer membrane protein [uncultured Methylovirgula sp.]
MLRKIIATTALTAISSVILGSVAIAADLPSTKGPPVYAPPPPPAFSWSGVYIGGQVGYDWGTTGVDDLAPFPRLSQSGVIGGAHIGYNYQVSQFVFGLEGDVNGASTRASNTSAGLFYGLHENEDFSIRGRIGYAFDRILVYATGGGAYGNFHTSYNDGVAFDSFNNGHFGWTVGGGIEYAIDNNWSVRAEYRYTDYGRQTDSPVFSDVDGFVTHHIRDNRVQAGFSYKFDMFAPPAPIVSKY